MLRHVVLMKLREDATPLQRAEVVRRLAAMKDEIPELKELTVGPAAFPGGYEIGLIADVEDAEAFARYVPHPVHQAVIDDLLTPLMTDVATIQIDLGGLR
jgi:hypothetical protein